MNAMQFALKYYFFLEIYIHPSISVQFDNKRRKNVTQTE